MSEIITTVGIAVGFSLFVALLMPIMIGIAERWYSRYCSWVWDKLGV